MTYQTQKFADNKNVEFFNTLRQRVSSHFKSNNVSRHGNWNMILKTIVMFVLYFTPYAILFIANVTNPLIFIGLWIMMGVGMAGIGLSVMHDANHGAYSKKKWVNKYLGYSMNLIGANAELWKLQHNRLHHTYTNIEGADDDINTPGILRFSPHKKRYWIHKFQFLYAWFFYGLFTLLGVTFKEFGQMFRYKKMGLIKGKKKLLSMFRELLLWKVFYYGYILVLPLIFLSAPVWLIILSFVLMHFTTGLILSLIFQTAHVMPECEFPVADENGMLEHSWAVHEMVTTTNFAPKSRVFSWFIGGLNFQVEHHLFPSICHIHYRRLSEIVSATAKEYGVPYNTQKSFPGAIWNHLKMLHSLGRLQPVAVAR